MKRFKPLHFHEEIMLLVLKDKDGTFASGTWSSLALGGAVLAELMMEKRIEVEEIKKKKYVKLLNRTAVGEPVIDECLTRIAEAKKRAQLQTWVSKLGHLKNFKHKVAGQLVRRGILRIDEDNVLGIFKRKVYPEIDPQPERELIERLREAIFGDSTEIDPRTVVLLSLAQSADILKLFFDRKELKKQKQRIERIVNGELIGKATKEAVQAVQAAVMVACIMPAVIATTTAAGR